MKKYKLDRKDSIKVDGHTLYRIIALRDIPGIVKKGEPGGYIQCHSNLSHAGNAWVSGNAWVYGNAKVSGNAQVYGYAQVSNIAQVFGNVRVSS